MRAPVSKRSSAYGRLSSWGSSLATVWARTQPDAGVALKPPVPQPQSRYSPSTGVFEMIGEASGDDVHDAAPGPQHVRAREDREELEGGGHLVLDDVERAALAEAVVAVDPGAEDQLALVRLADVDVDGVRHDDGRVDRLEQLRHQRLQRVALERQPDPGHRRDDRGVPGRDDGDLAGADRTARGLDAGDPAAVDVDGRSPRRPR